MSKIFVVIPAYNEAETIYEIVMTAKAFAYKVIVCDDGSFDDTASQAKLAGAEVVRHESNRGKGAAFRTLFETCIREEADYVVTIDGDGQHEPSEIPILLERIVKSNADIVIGSRFLGKGKMPYARVAGNKFLTFLTNMNAIRNVTDTQSGFRAYRLSALKQIPIYEEGFAIDSQILIEAAKKNLKIEEVQISVNYENNTPSENPFVQMTTVSGRIVRFMLERRPLLSFGIIGVALIVIGALFGIRVLMIFNETNQIAVGTSIISVSFGIAGIIIVVGGAILHLINLRSGVRVR